MSILHAVNQELKIVLSTWIGAVSDLYILQSYKRLYESEFWKPGFNEIIDLRKAGLGAITDEGLLNLNSLVRSYTDGKCDSFDSVLVATDELASDLALTYEAFNEDAPEKIMVFKSLGEAFEWFGVDGYQ